MMYGIEFGEYSDRYMHEAVYTSRDDAYAVARTGGGIVLEFGVDPPLAAEAVRLRRPGERFWYVHMRQDGDGASANEEAPKIDDDHEASAASERYNGFTTRCWARDEVHAIKIGNDRRLGWIAAGKPYSYQEATTGTAWARIPG